MMIIVIIIGEHVYMQLGIARLRKRAVLVLSDSVSKDGRKFGNMFRESQADNGGN